MKRAVTYISVFLLACIVLRFVSIWGDLILLKVSVSMAYDKNRLIDFIYKVSFFKIVIMNGIVILCGIVLIMAYELRKRAGVVYANQDTKG